MTTIPLVDKIIQIQIQPDSENYGPVLWILTESGKVFYRDAGSPADIRAGSWHQLDNTANPTQYDEER